MQTHIGITVGGLGISIPSEGGGGPAPLSIAGTPPATVVRDELYDWTPAVSGGQAPYSFAFIAGNQLATGMQLNTATGRIYGRPLYQWNTTGLILRVTDDNGDIADLGPFDIAVTSPTVDGYQVGDPGAVGTLYEGYILGFADHLVLPITEGLLLAPGHHYGRYMTSKNYTVGMRGGDTRLNRQYNTDPLHTGYKDSNRGQATLASNWAKPSASEVKLQAVLATAQDRYTFEGTSRFIKVAAMMASAAYQFYPGAAGNEVIVEWRSKYSSAAGNPRGSHSTEWTWSMDPGFLHDSASTAQGTAAGATTDAAGYAVGATAVNLAATGTGTLVSGDLIQFAGHTTWHRVYMGDTSVADGGVIILAEPGLKEAIPAAATAITVMDQKANSDINEWDFEGNSQGRYLNQNDWLNAVISGNASPGAIQSVHDDTYRITAMKLTSTAVSLHYGSDAAAAVSIAANANTRAKSATLYLTNHAYAGSTAYKGESLVDADWVDAITAGKSPDGMVATYDYVRVWIKAGKQIDRPRVTIPPKLIDSGAGGTLVLPAATAIWGRTPTAEVFQGIPHEENEHGVSHTWAYSTGLPPDFTYNAGTRTLTISNKVVRPGRVNLILTTKESGGLCEPLRIPICIGPRVTAPNFTVSNGQSVDIDVWHLIDCGVLTSDDLGNPAKSATLTGLPAGLSFNPATFRITGTVTAANGSGPYTYVLTGTNSVGQSGNASGAITVEAQPSYKKSDAVAWYRADEVETDPVTNVRTIWNKKALHTHSNLTATTRKADGGLGGATMKVVANASPNGALPVIRITKDAFAPPRAYALPGDPVSKICQGDDKPFSVMFVLTPNSTDVIYPWAWGNTLPGTTQGVENIDFQRNNGNGPTSSRLERIIGTGTSPFATNAGWLWTTGSPKVVIVTFDGHNHTTWFNNNSEVSGAIENTSFSDTLAFMLFARFGTMSNQVVPSIGAASGAFDWMETMVWDRALTAVEAEQYLAECQTEWGVTPS